MELGPHIVCFSCGGFSYFRVVKLRKAFVVLSIVPHEGNRGILLNAGSVTYWCNWSWVICACLAVRMSGSRLCLLYVTLLSHCFWMMLDVVEKTENLPVTFAATLLRLPEGSEFKTNFNVVSVSHLCQHIVCSVLQGCDQVSVDHWMFFKL